MAEEKPGEAHAGAPPAEADDGVDDLLGLAGPEPTGEQASKRRRLSGPKLRKTREELLEEEVVKAQAKYQEVLSSMSDVNSPMPTCAGIAKLERVVKAKLEEAKESASFTSSTELEELATAVAALKEAVRITGIYLPPSGHPKKKPFRELRPGLEKAGRAGPSKVPGSSFGTLSPPLSPKGQAAVGGLRFALSWVVIGGAPASRATGTVWHRCTFHGSSSRHDHLYTTYKVTPHCLFAICCFFSSLLLP